ncbi:hypothetical protein BH10PLA2_BH10PLA2_22380 [soil metagenome]
MRRLQAGGCSTVGAKSKRAVAGHRYRVFRPAVPRVRFATLGYKMQHLWCKAGTMLSRVRFATLGFKMQHLWCKMQSLPLDLRHNHLGSLLISMTPTDSCPSVFQASPPPLRPCLMVWKLGMAYCSDRSPVALRLANRWSRSVSTSPSM